jgi:hypothetical protein
MTLLGYASYKGFHLTTKHNPQVTSAILYDKYDTDEVLNLEEWDQYFAFAV